MGSAKEYRKFSFRERIYCLLTILGASQVALVVKNAPASAGDTRQQVLFLGLGTLEEEMATHSSVLA